MDTTPIFPVEIILKILTNLPAKTLHRFKCVSKPWLSLITSPHFLKAYLTLSPPHPSSWVLTYRDPRMLPTDPNPNISFPLVEPPNITYLTVTGRPDLIPPEIIQSSNGLILYAINRHFLFVTNPVTNDYIALPISFEITNLNRMAFLAKYTPTYDDVSIVLVELQAPNDPSYQAATMLIYRTDTDTGKGEWDTRAAKYTAGSIRCPVMWQADNCFEASGKLFWCQLTTGILVMDDPFGERLELRFIPLPEGHELPHDTSDLKRWRQMYPCSGYVQMITIKYVWRLTDVEKGEWSPVFKIIFEVPSGMPEGLGRLGLSAFHPFDPEVVVMTVQDKCILVNLKENKVLEICTGRWHEESDEDRKYPPVLLPCWPTPLPRRYRASSFKGKGNFEYKNKNFEDAISYYSKSIRYLPMAATYANRAAAHLQLGKYQEAEIDCSEALRLDNQYLKVYVRRATARKELGKLLEAKEDVEMALKLDGGLNQETLKLSSEVNCLLEKEALEVEDDSGL